MERERSEPAPQPRREAARRVNRAPAARRTRAKRACPAGGAPSLGAQRQAAGAEPRPSDGRRCSPCRITPRTRRQAGEARGRRGGYTPARNVARSGLLAGSCPSHLAARAQPAACNVPSMGVYASAGAGLRPAGAPRMGLRHGMGYTFSHPMDAAPRRPLGAARQARALRLQDRLASLASCGPQAPDSRAEPLRVSAAEQARFARAPRAAGALVDAATPFGLRLRSMVASLPLHGPRAPQPSPEGAGCCGVSMDVFTT